MALTNDLGNPNYWWESINRGDFAPNFYEIPGGPGTPPPGSPDQTGNGTPVDTGGLNSFTYNDPNITAWLNSLRNPQTGSNTPQQFVTAEQQNAQARYDEVMRELNAIMRRGPGMWSGDLGSYVRQILGSLPMTPEIQNRIGQIQQTFQAIQNAGVNVLPPGSSAPLGNGGQAPIITQNPDGSWGYFNGFSPTQLQAPGGANLAAANNAAGTFNLQNPAFINLFRTLNGPNGVNPNATLPGGGGSGGGNTGATDNTDDTVDSNLPQGFSDWLQMMRQNEDAYNPWQTYSRQIDDYLQGQIAPMFRNISPERLNDQAFMQQYYEALNTARQRAGMPTFLDLWNNNRLNANNATFDPDWFAGGTGNMPYLPTDDPGQFRYIWNDPDSEGANPGLWGLTFNPEDISTYGDLKNMVAALNSNANFRNMNLMQDPMMPYFYQDPNGYWLPVSADMFNLNQYDIGTDADGTGEDSIGYNQALNNYLLSTLPATHPLQRMIREGLTPQNFNAFYDQMNRLRRQNFFPTTTDLLSNAGTDIFAGTPLADAGFPYLPGVAAPQNFGWNWFDPDDEGANPGALAMFYQGAAPTNYQAAMQLAATLNNPLYQNYNIQLPTSLNQMFTRGTGTNGNARFGVNASFFNTPTQPNTTNPYPTPIPGGGGGGGSTPNNTPPMVTPPPIRTNWGYMTTGRRPGLGGSPRYYPGAQGFGQFTN